MEKKIRLITILITCCICFGSLYTMASAKYQLAEEREYVKTVGNFEYTYRFYRDKGYLDGVWIININPISNQKIEKLKIPDSIDGKNVIRIGNVSDDDYDVYMGVKNIFGIYENEDYRNLPWYPIKQVNTVNEIKHIILPKYLREMTACAFQYVQDGKTIYVPSELKQNVIDLAQIRWKSIKISKDNKWFKVNNKCILSKSGNKVYGYFGTETKVKIPDGVKYIAKRAFYYKNIEEIFIPKSVRKIGAEALQSLGENTAVIKLSEKNTYFGLENNCIYNKKTGRLVAAYEENGIITIPKAVTCVKGYISYSGNKVKKIIIPGTVKQISGYWYRGMKYDDSNLKVEFLSAIPPKGLDWFPESVISVPKGGKERYEKALLEAWDDYNLTSPESNVVER